MRTYRDLSSGAKTESLLMATSISSMDRDLSHRNSLKNLSSFIRQSHEIDPNVAFEDSSGNKRNAVI